MLFTVGHKPDAPICDEVDFTIVIAHRGSAMGLWATIHSCEIDLVGSPYKYNYVIVWNGEGENKSLDTRNVMHFLAKSGKLRDELFFPNPLSPPSARQVGTRSANGRYLFFFDNHCLVARDYFKRAMEMLEKYNMDELHSTFAFYLGEDTNGNGHNWYYKLKLENNFWGGSELPPEVAADCAARTEPFRIGVSGHGAFIVRRKVWEEVGGYWEGFEGYGGEEVYFDLKMWMLGKEVWVDPLLLHYHYAGQRGYSRHYTDQFFLNMMMCANIIGGPDWLPVLVDSFGQYSRARSEKTLMDIAIEASDRSSVHAKELASKRKYSLDELFKYFDTQKIPY